MVKPTVKVVGRDDLIKDFKALGREISGGLEGIVVEAVEPVVQDAQGYAPQASGDLADGIHEEVFDVSEVMVEVAVGPDDEQFYSLFVELGVDPHHIERDQAQGMEVEAGEFASSAKHPGHGAQPFLRPAFDQNVDVVVDEIIKGLNKLL